MATNEQPEDRWETIKKLWHDEKFVYQILGGLVLVGIGVWIGLRLFGGDPGYATNLYTEVLSISMTVLVVDLLARRREEQREEARFKQREEARLKQREDVWLKRNLIVPMGSQVTDTAVSAANELLVRGWLVDGSLKGANLMELPASEDGPDQCQPPGGSVYAADLQGAFLSQVNLREAGLRSAKLPRAELWNANLEAADFWCADLQGANLARANLGGAILLSANLQGADLSDAWFDEDMRASRLHEVDARY